MKRQPISLAHDPDLRLSEETLRRVKAYGKGRLIMLSMEEVFRDLW